MIKRDSKQILFITTEFPPGPGGIGTHAWNLARYINRKIPLDLITKSDYSHKEECDKFDALEKINIIRFRRYKFFIRTFFHRFFIVIKHIKNNNYTHYILSGFFSLTFAYVIKLLDAKTTTVCILHGSELRQANFILDFILKISLRKVDIIISVSNYTDQLIPIYLRNNQKKVVIPNGVDENLVKIRSSAKNSIMPGNPFLLTLGSISNRKGQANLIKALPQIISEYPSVHYHCVGLPTEKKKLLLLAKELGVSNYVTVHGFIKQERLIDFFNQADVLVMLSQNNIAFSVEGFGIAILEANLFGVPALGSKGTGIEEAIVQNKTGILVNPFSSTDIINGLNSILEKYSQYSKEAYKWSLEHSWYKIADNYLKVILDE